MLFKTKTKKLLHKNKQTECNQPKNYINKQHPSRRLFEIEIFFFIFDPFWSRKTNKKTASLR